MPTLRTSGTISSEARTSDANVPIPHARGGYVEKIAVRTLVVRPFRQVSGLQEFGVPALEAPRSLPGRGPP